jgi:hypothetical protein
VLDDKGFPTKRWKRHVADSYLLDTYLYRAIRKYGIQDSEIVEYITVDTDVNIIMPTIDNDTFDMTTYTESQRKCIQELIDKLNEAEINWVNAYNSMTPESGGIGYNSAPPGGQMPHKPHTEEHKQYISNMMKGQTRSEETKQKIRDKLIGIKLDDIRKENMKIGRQKRFDTEIFPKRLQEWINIYTKKGRRPNHYSKDKDERRCGQWQHDMMVKKKLNTLTEEQIQQLTNTPGWIWPCSDEFTEQFNNWKAQIEKYGSEIFKASKNDIDAKRASNWMRHIQGLKRLRSHRLTNEQINLLESHPKWVWEKLCNNSFEENVELWVNFYNTHNKYPSTKSENKDEAKLAGWQCRMRTEYRQNNKMLTQEKKDTLTNTTGWKWDG